MNIYEKLNAARKDFHSRQLKKSGHNKFAGYYYFELGDFIVPAMECFEKAGLCGVVSFGSNFASLDIRDTEGDDFIQITSPMSTAEMKGCYPVQQLGAVQTYLRRYLWVAALEIVEHDAIDATTGSDTPKSFKSISKSVQDDMPPETMAKLKSRADGVIDAFAVSIDDAFIQYDAAKVGLDADEQTAMWGLLPSNVRTAIKKFGQQQKGE